MNKHLLTSCLRAFCMLALVPWLKAQSIEPGLSVGLNLHTGLQLKSRQDELSPFTLGLGYEVGIGTSEGRWSVEAGFLYKPGSQHLLDPAGIRTAPGAALDSDYSKDSRKNQVDSVFLRVAFERPYQGVWLHAGLEAASARFRQEYIADVCGTVGQDDFRDTYNGVLTKRQLVLNPFIGISVPVDTDQVFRVSLTTFRYTSVDYSHVAGTAPDTGGKHTGSDAVMESRRTLPKVDFSYGFRF